jgi:hypothetical protein
VLLHGYSSDVGANGVVTIFISRKNAIRVGGIVTKPDTNIATNVAFEPLNKAGTRVAVAPDFSLEAGEVNTMIQTMRATGWDIGCLYNQESAEHPQLYFSRTSKSATRTNSPARSAPASTTWTCINGTGLSRPEAMTLAAPANIVVGAQIETLYPVACGAPAAVSIRIGIRVMASFDSFPLLATAR